MFSRRRRGHAGTDEEIVKTEDAEPEPFEEMVQDSSFYVFKMF